ncbi:hypothetical protein [Ferviditalea candida]|uniref:hypothetical protein n=1 Tax=Ferviditalea candida TaxID=3108399 RepID=UPI00352C4FD4
MDLQVTIQFDPFRNVETSIIHNHGIHIILAEDDEVKVQSLGHPENRLMLSMSKEDQIRLAHAILKQHCNYPDERRISNHEIETEIETHHRTMTEKLREIGMKERDFI